MWPKSDSRPLCLICQRGELNLGSGCRLGSQSKNKMQSEIPSLTMYAWLQRSQRKAICRSTPLWTRTILFFLRGTCLWIRRQQAGVGTTWGHRRRGYLAAPHTQLSGKLCEQSLPDETLSALPSPKAVFVGLGSPKKDICTLRGHSRTRRLSKLKGQSWVTALQLSGPGLLTLDGPHHSPRGPLLAWPASPLPLDQPCPPGTGLPLRQAASDSLPPAYAARSKLILV